jgi:hypothetical protein
MKTPTEGEAKDAEAVASVSAVTWYGMVIVWGASTIVIYSPY